MKKIFLFLSLILILTSCHMPFLDDSDEPITQAICMTDDECKSLAKVSKDSTILKQLALHEHKGVRALVAKNPNTPKVSLDILLEENDEIITNYVAANTSSGDEILNALAQSENDMIRHAVAYNPATPEETLINFANDSSPNVQKKLAENANLTEEIMLKMAEESMNSALVALLERDDLPESVLVILRESENEFIKNKALGYFNK